MLKNFLKIKVNIFNTKNKYFLKIIILKKYLGFAANLKFRKQKYKGSADFLYLKNASFFSKKWI